MSIIFQIRRGPFHSLVFATCLLATLCGRSQPAQAQYMLGQDLLTACTSEEPAKIYSCMHYIAGVIDYHIVMQSLGTTPTVDFCLPDKVSLEQAAVTVLSYLKRQPQHQAFIAAPAVALALHESFPCAPPKTKSKKK